MAIDLLSIQPHQVSRDLSGYITFIYGAPKTGKTTLASQMPDCLLLAFERGYNAIPGIIAQDVTSWIEMKQVYKQLQKPEVRARFKTVVIDTVDIAASCCEKYICNQNDIDTLGDLGFGKGWLAFKKEFEEVFRGLTQLGYAVFFISHDKEYAEKDEYGEDTGRIMVRPSLSTSSRSVIENMADIYGYARAIRTEEGSKVRLLLRSDDGRVACGCRFKFIEPAIDFTYDALAHALSEAINKEAELTGNKYVTSERETVSVATVYNYDECIDRVNNAISQLMSKDPDKSPAIITEIVDKYLGKGKKVSETGRDQAGLVYLIASDLEELL